MFFLWHRDDLTKDYFTLISFCITLFNPRLFKEATPWPNVTQAAPDLISRISSNHIVFAYRFALIPISSITRAYYYSITDSNSTRRLLRYKNGIHILRSSDWSYNKKDSVITHTLQTKHYASLKANIKTMDTLLKSVWTQACYIQELTVSSISLRTSSNGYPMNFIPPIDTNSVLSPCNSFSLKSVFLCMLKPCINDLWSLTALNGILIAQKLKTTKHTAKGGEGEIVQKATWKVVPDVCQMHYLGKFSCRQNLHRTELESGRQRALSKTWESKHLVLASDLVELWGSTKPVKGMYN